MSSAKYRRVVFTEEVVRCSVYQDFVNVCQEIEKRYNIFFLEIGTGKNHVHFLIQGVPGYSVNKISDNEKEIDST
jgi:putative transposase